MCLRRLYPLKLQPVPSLILKYKEQLSSQSHGTLTLTVLPLCSVPVSFVSEREEIHTGLKGDMATGWDCHSGVTHPPPYPPPSPTYLLTTKSSFTYRERWKERERLRTSHYALHLYTVFIQPRDHRFSHAQGSQPLTWGQTQPLKSRDGYLFLFSFLPQQELGVCSNGAIYFEN